MKKILTATLTGLALAGSIGGAGSAVADTTADLGNANLPTVVPLSGLLNPQERPAEAPAPHPAVQGLLPGH